MVFLTVCPRIQLVLVHNGFQYLKMYTEGVSLVCLCAVSALHIEDSKAAKHSMLLLAYHTMTTAYLNSRIANG